MLLAIVLIASALIVVFTLIVLRRAGGGRFPWLQFYLKGRESGFDFREINLLRRVAVESKLENPTSLFWSMKQLDRSIKGVIVRYRSRSQEQDPEYNRLLSKLFELRKRVEFELPKYKIGIKSSRKISPRQSLRIMLPGLGPFTSSVVENLPRYLAIQYPQGPKLPEGFSWKNQKIAVHFWRAEDAGYSFQTKVLGDYLDRQYPILHVSQSDNLLRTQKRNSVRAETNLDGELFPLKSIGLASENAEEGRGLRCRVVDISEGGCAVLIGGKAKVGLPLKLQFSLGDGVVIVNGVVKGINFDEKKGRSLLHVQAVPPGPTVRNRILTYVYNLFGERQTSGPPKKEKADAGRGGSSEGVVIRATPPNTNQSAPR